MVRTLEYRDSGPCPLRLGEMQLDPLPASVPRARRWFDRLTEGLEWADGQDECRLLLSELVTNAIVHTRTDAPWMVRVVWWRQGRAIQVEVRDPDAGSKASMRSSGADDTDGRGLHLVDQLAHSWGVEFPARGGKSVWFRLEGAFADLPPACVGKCAGCPPTPPLG